MIVKGGMDISMVKFEYILIIVLNLVLISSIFTTFAQCEENKEYVLKTAILHIGTIEDYGWTLEGHMGAIKMSAELPYVKLSEKENAFGPNTSQILREYALSGNKLIFGHSYNFGEDITEVAPEFPNVTFMWGAGVEKTAPNVGMYFGRMYEVRYLTGIVAGAMTKTDKIGYTAAIPIPEVIRGIDAFAKGVATVNSDAEIRLKWVGDWYNPPKEKDITLSLIDEGCDVVAHHTDSFYPGLAAEERGVYYIGFGYDTKNFVPNATLTGALWNWGPIMINIAELVHNGSWEEYPGQDWWYGLADDGVKLAPYGNTVPQDLRDMIEEKKKAIVDGEFEIFPGMTDQQLREINYFEPNVKELPST